MVGFEDIEAAYRELDENLLSSGKLTCWNTEKGFFGSSSATEVFDFFNKVGLSRFKNFVDIGSGDGRVVAVASLFTNATGIEHDKELHHSALHITSKLGIRAKLFNSDFMEHDLSGYDFVFINPDKHFSKIEHKLLRELSGVLAVYNSIFLPRFLRHNQRHWAGQTPVTVYTR